MAIFLGVKGPLVLVLQFDWLRLALVMGIQRRFLQVYTPVGGNKSSVFMSVSLNRSKTLINS